MGHAYLASMHLMLVMISSLSFFDCFDVALLFVSLKFNTSADYDLYAVLDDYDGPLKLDKKLELPDVGVNEILIEKDNIDVTVFHKDYWARLLEKNHLVYINCEELSPELTICKKRKFPWKLNFMALKHEVYSYTQ
jgi:hypothetical protein